MSQLKKLRAGITGQISFDNSNGETRELVNATNRAHEEMCAMNHETRPTPSWVNRIKREVAASERGRVIYAWILECHAKGMTVYARTAMRAIKIAPKHIDRVRVNGSHCEVMRGKHWDSINFTNITAREE